MLRSHLVWPKDPADPATQDSVVYRIPCECGKVYIGETGRPMKDRIKEHDRDIHLARTKTSAISEHAHNTGHCLLWDEVKFIDRDCIDTHVGSKRRFTKDFTLTTSTGIVELKFQKQGCPRSRNTTTGELQKTGPLREQPTSTARIKMHQSQLLKTNQSQQSIVVYKVSHNQSTSLPDED